MRPLLLLTALVPSAAYAVDLELVGDCPGPVSITVSGLTPGASFALLSAADLGSTPVPVGRCAGTRLGLGAGTTPRVVTTDRFRDGVEVLVPSIPEPACGLHLQAIDMSSCAVSSVEQIAEAPAPFGGTLYASRSGGVSDWGLWRIDLATGATEFVELAQPITGMAFGDLGLLYGIRGVSAGGPYGPDVGKIYRIDPASGALFEVTQTFQESTSLAFADGLLYTADGGVDYRAIDPSTGEEEVLGGRPLVADPELGNGFGASLAWNGATMYYVNDRELMVMDGIGDTALIAHLGLYDADGRGGGATFHDGQLWIAAEELYGDGTRLWIIDPVTGEATDTGIVIPDDRIDALASPTP